MLVTHTHTRTHLGLRRHIARDVLVLSILAVRCAFKREWNRGKRRLNFPASPSARSSSSSLLRSSRLPHGPCRCRRASRRNTTTKLARSRTMSPTVSGNTTQVSMGTMNARPRPRWRLSNKAENSSENNGHHQHHHAVCDAAVVPQVRLNSTYHSKNNEKRGRQSCVGHGPANADFPEARPSRRRPKRWRPL